MLARERVKRPWCLHGGQHDARQALTMVTCWAVIPAVAAAVIALPAGMTLQTTVMQALASDQALLQQTVGTPPAASCTSTPLSGLAGLAHALAGALGPAAFAATARDHYRAARRIVTRSPDQSWSDSAGVPVAVPHPWLPGRTS